MFGGGGNLVGYYKQARMVIGRYHRDVKKLVILPHTIKGNEDLLGELGENADIIVREPVSFEHVKKHNAKSRVMIMDDLALSLDVHELFAWKPGGLARYALKKQLTGNARKSEATVPSPTRIISNNLFEFRRYLGRVPGGYSDRALNCFRTGLEATDIALPADNVDLSKVYAYGVHNEELIRYASRRLLKFMNRYHEISTNRLHLCVAGALLGKRVRFYPNSYWKCEAIFNYSIRGRFDNVEWRGDSRG